MTSPEPAPATPDQLLLRSHLQAAVGPPDGFGPRLGWIASKALESFRHPWTYLLLVGYILIVAFIWILTLFFGGFLTLFVVELILLSGGSANLAGFCAGLFALGAGVSLGLMYTGYNAGTIRMMAPMLAGRAPDPMAFPAGVLTHGPRLLVVFCVALLLASLPIWLTVQFVIDLLQKYGWDTIASPWNRTLQWWILGQMATRLAGIAFTLAAMNLLLGPWQTVVGIRNVNAFTGLGLTITTLIRQFPVSLVVLGVFAAVQYGLNVWSETASGAAMLVQLLLMPPATVALLCLMTPDYMPETRPVRTPTRGAPGRPMAAPNAGPPPATNPVPGLLPNR